MLCPSLSFNMSETKKITVTSNVLTNKTKNDIVISLNYDALQDLLLVLKTSWNKEFYNLFAMRSVCTSDKIDNLYSRIDFDQSKPWRTEIYYYS